MTLQYLETMVYQPSTHFALGASWLVPDQQQSN